MRHLILFPVLFACGVLGGSGDTDDTDDDTQDSDGNCRLADEVPCEDQLLLDLSLQDSVSTGAVVTSREGDDFVTQIDATAGGFSGATSNPFVYVRFEATGARRVDLDDEAALASGEWHLAARRFVLRLNGGSSGPSCVGAMDFPQHTYQALDTVPGGTRFDVDAYYTEDCTIINDSSGLPGSPQVALGAWWSYPGCVATTETPFLVQLEDGKVLKLVVESFYSEGQDTCNATGNPGSGSGNLTLRWRFLD